jgi:hypothetical protein
MTGISEVERSCRFRANDEQLSVAGIGAGAALLAGRQVLGGAAVIGGGVALIGIGVTGSGFSKLTSAGRHLLNVAAKAPEAGSDQEIPRDDTG